MRITDEEREEIRRVAASASMRTDARILRESRHNPFISGGVVDSGRVIQFLCDYNAFLGHPLKPGRPFLERDLKL